jgi:hypothetical protein
MPKHLQLPPIRVDHRHMAPRHRGLSQALLKRQVPAILLLALCTLSSLAQSPTVFKWTDAQGLVHYSERPPAQSSTPPVPVSVKVSPRHSPPPPATSGTDAFAEQFRRQAAAKPPAPPRPAASSPRVVSESNGTEDGTDASRCALARDILKGALRHSNGKPIDQYDLDTARNDVRMFCKAR